MAQLRIYAGESIARISPLKESVFTIGRHPDCNFVIASDVVSRKHARIILRPDGYYIEDLGSRNGTYVNDVLVDDLHPLVEGDCIRIDETVMTLESGTPTPVPATHWDERSIVDGARDYSLVEQRQLTRETISGQRFLSGEIEETGVDPQVTLQAILDITRSLGGALDVNELLTGVLESVFRVFSQAELAYILERSEHTGELGVSAAKQRDVVDFGQLTLGPISRSIAREVLLSGSAVLSTDGNRLPSATEQSVFSLGARSVLCAPLIGPSREPLGILYVESSEDELPFDTNDLDVLSCIAILAGQAIEHARLHSDRYRAVVDTAVDGIVTIDERGDIEFANPATERLFGYDQTNLVGKNVCDLIRNSATESRESQSSFLDAVADSPPSHTIGSEREAIGMRQDGSSFPVYLSIGEFRLGGKLRFTGIIHDDTHRKKAEEQLKALNESLELRVADRTRHVKMLQEIAIIANESETIDEALQATMECVCRHLNWPAARAWLPKTDEPGKFANARLWYGDALAESERAPKDIRGARCHSESELIGRVIKLGRPFWMPNGGADRQSNATEDPDAGSLQPTFAFPILVGPEVCAVLEFYASRSATADNDLLEVMAHAGTQLGRVVERCRLQQQLVDAVWDQQRNFGQELHDSLGQEMTGIRLLADSLSRKLKSQSRPEADAAEELTQLILSTQQSVRRLSKGLCPVEIFDEGLMAALEELAENVARQSGVSCTFHCRSPIEIRGNDMATHLFRIAQEAVNNALKHSQAGQITIELSNQDAFPYLKVTDDGIGCDEFSNGESLGMGMRIMRYRANAIGGVLHVERAANGGTVVACRLRTTADAERT